MVAKRKPKAKTGLLGYELHVIGHWIFLFGILLAIALGTTMPDKKFVASVLALFGIAIGLLNIKTNETHNFLLAGIALIISSQSFKFIPIAGPTLVSVLQYFIVLVAPAVVIVSLLAIYKVARGR
ncbi:MAG: hypothetical protein HYT16_03075 [DPANN group archaeon]|nr:hypothetical protein [DPANN group archaeon]